MAKNNRLLLLSTDSNNKEKKMPNSPPLLFYALGTQKNALVRVTEEVYEAKDDFSSTDLGAIRSRLAQSGYLATCLEIGKDQPMISLTYNSSSPTPFINAWSRKETTNPQGGEANQYYPARPSNLLYPAAILYALRNKGGSFKNAYNESPRLSLTQEAYEAIWYFYLEVTEGDNWNERPLKKIYKKFNPATAQPQHLEKAQRPADQINEEVMARVLFRLVSAKYQTVYLDGRALKKTRNQR
jgi:hypothetical protein